MSDMIYRDDAIDLVLTYFIPRSHTGERGEHEEDFVRTIFKALPSAEAEPSLKAIKRQIDEHWYLDPPSAEAVQGWIPCEEEMPIDSEEVIASVYWTKDGDSIIAYGHYSARFDKWRLYSDVEGELIKGYEVTAWMPLPKPYKGGDTE